MDIKVMEFQTPVIKINYEILKAELENSLENYKGLIVTEDTLAGCKAAQKELAGLRTKIDAYRKDKKKELEQPIKAFEAQCKELIGLVDSVEQPIKAGIKVFDDQKREEKRNLALQIIAKVAEETGLNQKYADRLDVLDKYTNLTATAKAIKEDVETRAFALKVEQDREIERQGIIAAVLESENNRLKTKLSIDLWKRDIDMGIPTSEIIEKIKAQAAVVYEAENKPVEPPKEPEPTNIPTWPEKSVNEPQENPEKAKKYKVTFEVIGDYETQRKVSDFLKANGIAYSVVSQVELWT